MTHCPSESFRTAWSNLPVNQVETSNAARPRPIEMASSEDCLYVACFVNISSMCTTKALSTSPMRQYKRRSPNEVAPSWQGVWPVTKPVAPVCIRSPNDCLQKPKYHVKTY